ncbi:MAG: DUF1993 domain-containing protein [Steroidobacteraceae bacterium]
MSFSLYLATVPGYQQMLGAVRGLLDKAEAHCKEKGQDPAALIQAKLAPDMLPFAYQIKSTAVHSIGAIEGLRKGVFSPDRTTPPVDFDGLRAKVSAASEALAQIKPAELDGFMGRDMRFEIGDYRLEFTAENFLLSFSQPNFYFHVTTAYDILRWQGVNLGKRDYLGTPRVKPKA